jgi:hypothetical protein
VRYLQGPGVEVGQSREALTYASRVWGKRDLVHFDSIPAIARAIQRLEICHDANLHIQTRDFALFLPPLPSPSAPQSLGTQPLAAPLAAPSPADHLYLSLDLTSAAHQNYLKLCAFLRT